MIPLRIHHRTSYRYHQPVSLGPHRLMLRPRESRDLRLISSDVAVTPDALVTWAHDVFGNAVATATFQTMADNLLIDSVAELQLDAAAWPVFDVAASAIFYPFRYSDDEWIDLGALTIKQSLDPAGRLRGWAQAFVGGNPTDTLALLKDLSTGVSGWICYQSREDEGSQSPTQNSGPCLGGSLCAGRGLDHLRSDEPQCRRLQSDPRRRRARHPAGNAGDRQFRGND